MCDNPDNKATNLYTDKEKTELIEEFWRIVFDTDQQSIACDSDLGVKLADLSKEFNLCDDFKILFNGKTISKLKPNAKEFFPQTSLS